MKDYIQIGDDRIQLRVQETPELDRMFGTGKWMLDGYTARSFTFRPATHFGFSLRIDGHPGVRRLTFGKPADVEPGQKIGVSSIAVREGKISVTLERAMSGALKADTPKPRNPFVELQNTLEAHVRAINALKDQLGSDMELRLTDTNRLAILLIATIN